jgi:hypothetical protein
LTMVASSVCMKKPAATSHSSILWEAFVVIGKRRPGGSG